MMRLVVDTNQADPIRFSFKQLSGNRRPTLVIPIRIWAELLHGGGADARRRALSKFDLRFGMDMPAIIDELAGRSEDRIRSFVPVYEKNSLEHGNLLKTFLYPTRPQLAMADEYRKEGVSYRQRVIAGLPIIRKKHKDQANTAKSLGKPLETADWYSIQDGTGHLFLKQDAPYRRWLINEVSTDANDQPRPLAAKSGDGMFDAVWDNPIFRRFLRLQALVNLGYAQAWSDPKHNRQVRMGNDDVPDISLVLYARDDDTILTADGIQDRIRHVDIEKSIEVTTWDSWLATQAPVAS